MPGHQREATIEYRTLQALGAGHLKGGQEHGPRLCEPVLGDGPSAGPGLPSVERLADQLGGANA
jgi:hypothetical protein